MSKRLSVLVVVALIAAAAATSGCTVIQRSTGSGGTWVWENPMLAGNDLLGADALDDMVGWAVGKRGTIIKTVNGGKTEQLPTQPLPTTSFTKTRTEYSGTTRDLEDVSIANTETVWAVGRGGTILKTANSGQTWLPQKSGTTVDLFAVEALDPQRAVSVGYHGKILRTTNGGATWTDLGMATGPTLLDVDFVDANLGFAGGEDGRLLKTTNGGASWTAVADDLPAAGDVTGISFFSGQVGWATTWDGIAGITWLTENGGLHWVKADTAPNGTKMESVSSEGPDTAWAVGTDGYTYFTDSAGAMGTKSTLTTHSLRATAFAGTTAWAVGDAGAVFTHNGDAWQQSSVDAIGVDLNGYSAEGAWAVGDGGATFRFSTSPFGQSWNPLQFGTEDITAIELFDAGTGWIAAKDGRVGRINAGAIESQLMATAAEPTAISAIDGAHGWMTGVLGADGVIYEVTGGTTWSLRRTETGTPLYGVAAQPNAVVVCGAGGKVGRRTDTGWAFATWGHSETMRSVAGLGPNVFVAVGDKGKVMRTIDAGNTWSVQDLGDADLLAVSFENGQHGIAVGRAGAMFETADGGLTWAARDSGTKRDLRAVGVGANGTRAVGAAGTILVELAGPPTESLYGAGRYDTAVAISKATFTPGQPKAVVIATGQNWPDAISGASLAGASAGPILLVTKDSLPTTVAAEIERLQVSKAYILGSDTVVSEAVLNAVKGKLTGARTAIRVAGAGRYETSAKIASATVDELVSQGGGWDHRVFLATGQNWPDALAASPVSANMHRPILLVPPTGLPTAISDVTTKLGVQSAVALGSGSVVPTSVVDQYDALITGSVDRWAGPSRYGTAAEVAVRAIDDGFPFSRVGLATGTNFPDALAGGAAIGQLNGLLLLSDPGYLSPEAGTVIWEHQPAVTEVRFFGGENVFGPRPRGETMFVLTSGY